MKKFVFPEGKQIKEFISNLERNHKLDNFRIKNDIIVFETSSVLKDAVLLYCEQTSSKVHFQHQRKTQDLHMQNKKVILLVKKIVEMKAKVLFHEEFYYRFN